MNSDPPPSLASSPASPDSHAADEPLWRLATRTLSETLTELTQRSLRDNEPGLLVVSAVLGVIIGTGVVAIEGIVQLLHVVNFGIGREGHLSDGFALAWWRVLAAPIVGGLLAGAATTIIRRMRDRETVDAVEANALFGGKMSLTDSTTLTLLTVIAAGFGASVGMEAGFTQLGAGFASRVGQSLRVRRGDLRTLVGCGAAAAIAAAFNAPLAGAFYAFELVIGSYTSATLAPIAMAALFATLIVRQVFGAESIFTLDAEVHVASFDYVLFAVVGVVAAGIGVATMTGVTRIERGFRRAKLPVWSRPAIGGLVVGLIAVIFPQVLGSGHGAVQLTLDRAIPAGVLLGLVAAKGLASAVSVGSGFRGGLFSSSLMLGSAYGGAVVAGLQALVSALGFTEFTFDPAAYMLVGTASVAAAIIGAPITMILLVLELTGSFPAALSVMVGVLVASVVVRLTFGYSFATWRFHVRGVPIRGGYDIGWVRELTAGTMMRRDIDTAPMGMTIADFRSAFPLTGPKRIFVVDADQRYRGIVLTGDAHSPDLDDQQGQGLIDELRQAEDLYLLPYQNVRDALERFTRAEIETLAVVSDPAQRHVLGFLTEGYALRRYNQELERARAEEHGDRTLFGPE